MQLMEIYWYHSWVGTTLEAYRIAQTESLEGFFLAVWENFKETK